MSTKRVNRDAFCSLIQPIWKVFKGIAMEHFGENMYIFHFSDAYERKSVLRGRP